MVVALPLSKHCGQNEYALRIPVEIVKLGNNTEGSTTTCLPHRFHHINGYINLALGFSLR